MGFVILIDVALLILLGWSLASLQGLKAQVRELQARVQQLESRTPARSSP